MGSPHQFGYYHLQYCASGGAMIPDPGNGHQISIRKSLGICPLTIASAGESRTLPNPTIAANGLGVGSQIMVIADQITGSGTCTVQGQTFANEGDYVEFIVAQYNGTKAWMPLSGQSLGNIELNMDGWKVWDAMQTNLPGTPAADDLGLVTGTYLSAAPIIKSVDFGGTSTTAYARRQISVPEDYALGTNLTLKILAGMIEEVADTSAVVDVEAVIPTTDATSDMCTTAAQSINSPTESLKSFSLSGATIGNPGDSLDIRIKFAGVDAGDAGPNIKANILAVALSYTRRL
jgi:hypothetical protein